MDIKTKYNYLMYNNKVIEKKINELNTINEAEKNSRLLATANYYRYILLLIFWLLLIVLLLYNFKINS